MKVLALVLLIVAVAQAMVPKEVFMDVIPGAPIPDQDDSKIVNGQLAKRGQFPHQAAIIMDSQALCGGSLISTQWVLTAGHCAQGYRSFSITLGAQSRDGNEPGSITVTTTNKIVHEGYPISSTPNDIAVLKLNSPVKLSAYISMVHLPSRSDVGNAFVGAAVTVSGWGKTSDNAAGPPDQLSYVNLNVIANAECSKYYGGAITGFIVCCGAPGGKSTCSGDSGGPLILQGTGRPKQIGIVSFVSGNGCASGVPSGYVRITAHLDWIQKHTGIPINP